MLIYLAGRITSDPLHAYRFADAEMALAAEGHVILNPCMLPNGMEYEQYMRIDAAMIREADAVCFLQGWSGSDGAKRERRLAEALGKQIMNYNGMKRRQI